jgi:hypothetical protein
MLVLCWELRVGKLSVSRGQTIICNVLIGNAGLFALLHMYHMELPGEKGNKGSRLHLRTSEARDEDPQ